MQDDKDGQSSLNLTESLKKKKINKEKKIFHYLVFSGM